MKHLLIVGSPGVGKTTLIKRLMRAFHLLPIQGFVTEEHRDGIARLGYWLSLSDGRQVLLSNRNQVSVLDDVAVPFIDDAKKRARVLLIDELSKIEAASAKVSRAVRQALDQGPVVIATASHHPSAFISSLKRRRDVELIPLSVSNRDLIEEELAERLKFLCADNPSSEAIESQAKRICELIISAQAPVLDIEIQQSRLRQLVEQAFPDYPQRYHLLYEMRFRRLWQQFRQEVVT